MDSTTAGHTATSLTGPTSFDSKVLFGSRLTFSYTFNQPGTYTYDCTLHPYMMGSIIVVD
jgi:plastocyanin